MRNLLIGLVLGVLAVASGVVFAQTTSSGGLTNFKPEYTQAAQRACLYPTGGWTIIDCSLTTAASSAQLTAWSRYVVQCGDDSYLATGTATAQDADTSDGWVPAGAWLEFLTTDTLRFLSCRNKNADSDCRIWECR